LTLLLLVLGFASRPAGSPAADDRIDFDRAVRPLLMKRCGECHSAEKHESGLALFSRSRLLRGGDSGEPAIVPMKSGESLLIKLVSGEEPDRRMPPEGEPLSRDEIDLLRRWIDQGAVMPDDAPATIQKSDHWSLQPVKRPALPGPETGPSGPSAIDRFIADRLHRAGLKMSPRADRRTLIRRLFLVMHGLPPARADIEQFLRDDSPDVWEKLVDRVLASPRYGERWARHWLDAIRFGETHGFETNRERPNAWPYRDYVIDAFNTDKPYDVFVREQIAGDALGADVATGFLVAGPYDLVKSPDITLTLMQRQDELADLINTSGTVFLGLTLGCARCHNHKFDPVTQKDFYSLQAIFAGVQHGERPLPVSDDRQRKLAEIESRITALRTKLEPFRVKVGAASGKSLREPVRAAGNSERFDPVTARFIRFTVLATTGGEPCLDELEVYSGETNVALAAHGTKATASSTLPGYDIHKLEHIHDGRYGNGRSWISKEPGAGWVQLELPEPARIDRIEWARDREQKYGDRLATAYRIEAALEPGQWRTIASSEDRQPFKPGDMKPAAPQYQLEGLPETLALQGRQWLMEVEAAARQRDQLAAANMVYSGRFEQPGPTWRLYRGDPLAKREEVNPDTLEILGSLKLPATAPERERRVKFAEWLTQPNHPLTARVMVNRLWQYHFGTGLVDTPGDFGANGSRPSHPELLDWLAMELTEGRGQAGSPRWSLKHIHRLILLSDTWRQDSAPVKEALSVDADSRLLWRFPPRRLEAEAIRDSMLAASGVLNLQMGGPGFSAFEVELENVRHYFPKTSFGPDDWRRMIYMTKVRQEQDATFGVFDCPDASQIMPRRPRSTTPLQALNLLNSEFVLQQSELFARRVTEEAGTDPAAQVRRAFQRAFGRDPSSDEADDATGFVREHSLPQLCRALLNSNEFLFVP